MHQNYSHHLADNQTNETCPPDYDGFYCWPATPIGSMAQLACPLSSQKNRTMSRWCSVNITRHHDHKDTLVEWLPSNDTDCSFDFLSAEFIHPFPIISILDEDDSDLFVSSRILIWSMTIIVVFFDIGFWFSVVAFAIIFGRPSWLRDIIDKFVRGFTDIHIISVSTFIFIRIKDYIIEILHSSLQSIAIHTSENTYTPIRIHGAAGDHVADTEFAIWTSGLFVAHHRRHDDRQITREYCLAFSPFDWSINRASLCIIVRFLPSFDGPWQLLPTDEFLVDADGELVLLQLHLSLALSRDHRYQTSSHFWMGCEKHDDSLHCMNYVWLFFFFLLFLFL